MFGYPLMLQFQVLVAPVLALIGLAFLLNAVLQKFRDSRFEQLAFGVLFGGVIAFSMTHPLSIGEGMIFDTRTLLLGAAVAFAGPTAGMVAMVSGIICRILIGGAGATAGIISLLLTYTLAFGWHYFLKDRIKNNVLNDIMLGIMITTSAVALFVLPYELAISIIKSLLPTILTMNTLGMVAIGFVFRREVKQLEHARTLASDAQTDSLTKLLNRRGMDAEFHARTFDTRVGHALFYFDIDNFKQVNDVHGHAAGDAALAIVAARVKESIREEAIFSRNGGDEFSIYMPRLEAADVQAVADRIRTSVSSQAFTFRQTSFEVSISIGAYWSKSDMPIQHMIDYADAQLLLAKQAGKNRAQVAYNKTDNDAEAVA